MTLEQYISLIDKMQNQFPKIPSSLLYAQNKMLEINLPKINFQLDFANSLKTIDQLAIHANKYIDFLNIDLLNSLSCQKTILSNLHTYRFDVASTYFSHETSASFVQEAWGIINQVDFQNYEEAVPEYEENIDELSKIKGNITWEQAILIITFILSIISFVQDQLPNTQLVKIENSLQKLIEIQSQEVDLLKNLK